MNKRNFAVCLAVLSPLLFACKKELRTTAEQSTFSNGVSASLNKTQGNAVSTFSLKVIMLTASADNTVSYKIKSDGQPYIDGTDNVKAVFDQNGHFYFSTNTSKNSLAKRFVVYDLSDPVDPSNTYRPAFGRGFYNQYNYILSTAASQYGTNPFIPLQNLPINESECIAMSGNINGDGVNSIFKYSVRFHATKDDLAGTPTAFAVVKRVSETEWKIEPGTCGMSNDVGALWTGDTRNEVAKGNFHLPFYFILTKK